MSTPSSLAAWAARQPNRCPNGHEVRVWIGLT